MVGGGLILIIGKMDLFVIYIQSKITVDMHFFMVWFIIQGGEMVIEPVADISV